MKRRQKPIAASGTSTSAETTVTDKCCGNCRFLDAPHALDGPYAQIVFCEWHRRQTAAVTPDAIKVRSHVFTTRRHKGKECPAFELKR